MTKEAFIRALKLFYENLHDREASWPRVITAGTAAIAIVLGVTKGVPDWIQITALVYFLGLSCFRGFVART